MGALSLFTRFFSPSGCQVRVNPQRCLRNRLRGNLCELCFTICPTAALSYVDGSLHFCQEACSSCMGCTAVCPVDAVLPRFDLQQFVHRIKRAEQETVTLSCDHNRLFDEGEFLLPCLGIFSAELLVSVIPGRPRKTLRFNIRGCDDCGNQKASHRFQEHLKSLLQYGEEECASKVEFITAGSREQPEGDRRTFFKALRGEAVNVAASARTAIDRSDQEKTATSRAISLKSSLLREVLRSGEPCHPLAARMTPRLSIGENCRPCPRCAGICPTGALKLVRSEKEKKLVFDSSSCCGCGLCISFCKEGALAISCSLEN